MPYQYGYTLPSGVSQCPHCGLQIAYAPQEVPAMNRYVAVEINCPNEKCNVILTLMRRLDERASSTWVEKAYRAL